MLSYSVFLSLFLIVFDFGMTTEVGGVCDRSNTFYEAKTLIFSI
jgi:hypothetical protein